MAGPLLNITQRTQLLIVGHLCSDDDRFLNMTPSAEGEILEQEADRATIRNYQLAAFLRTAAGLWPERNNYFFDIDRISSWQRRKEI